jgi:hypothetical protein
MVRAMVEAMTEEVKGKAPAIPAPKDSNADLLSVYPMGDPHFGMYAWAEETGDDFDTDIAEKVTCAAIDRLIDSAPPSETAIILPLGDLIHADSSTNRTPNSGATLDVDTRWARVMQIALRALIYAIKKALAKHKKVLVRIVKGNHDPHASLAIALALDAYFHGEPRIKVDLSPAAHWYYKFGRVLIGSTHGDTTKEKDLLGVMASDRPKEWGDLAVIPLHMVGADRVTGPWRAVLHAVALALPLPLSVTEHRHAGECCRQRCRQDSSRPDHAPDPC